jgi:hypothetical protein
MISEAMFVPKLLRCGNAYGEASGQARNGRIRQDFQLVEP